MRKILLVLFLIGGILLLGNKIFSTSFAYSYDIDKSVLFYKDDYKELENDIRIYVDGIDDLIIPNSSYLYSDKLVDNYDFLVHFALDYVLNNKEYYSSKIEVMDSCLYVDKFGIEKNTSNYIGLDIIYEITEFYFGVKDFAVINDSVCMVDDYVSLSDFADNNFNFNIVDVEVSSNNDEIKAMVSYDGSNRYLYSFINDNNVLKIKNVEVVL